MTNISEHISWAEATHTATGLPNMPDEEQLEDMELLAEKVFEPLRTYISEPIQIDSFFRSKEVNAKVGGASNSQHCLGQAMDIKATPNASYTTADLFEFIKEKLVFDQLIWERGNSKNPDWVHVSYSPTHNRNEVLRSFVDKGKTKYMPYQ
jgi:hypothetical protein